MFDSVFLSGGIIQPGFCGKPRNKLDYRSTQAPTLSTVCPNCGGPARVETVTRTDANHHKTLERWTICTNRKQTKYRKLAASCPTIKEVIEDMGVFTEALEGVSLKKIADKIGLPWQKVGRAKSLDNQGKLQESEETARMVEAARELRQTDPECGQKKRPYVRKSLVESLVGSPYAPPPTQELAPALTAPALATVAHPPHYNHGKIEAIDVIEDWQLGFHLGNTLKYLCRAVHKGSEHEDLLKARWYLDRRIAQLGVTHG